MSQSWIKIITTWSIRPHSTHNRTSHTAKPTESAKLWCKTTIPNMLRNNTDLTDSQDNQYKESTGSGFSILMFCRYVYYVHWLCLACLYVKMFYLALNLITNVKDTDTIVLAFGMLLKPQMIIEQMRLTGSGGILALYYRSMGKYVIFVIWVNTGNYVGMFTQSLAHWLLTFLRKLAPGLYHPY